METKLRVRNDIFLFSSEPLLVLLWSDGNRHCPPGPSRKRIDTLYISKRQPNLCNMYVSLLGPCQAHGEHSVNIGCNCHCITNFLPWRVIKPRNSYLFSSGEVSVCLFVCLKYSTCLASSAEKLPRSGINSILYTLNIAPSISL